MWICLFPPLDNGIPLLVAASSEQKEWVIKHASDSSFMMHISIANCINSVGNKTKAKAKQIKLFIHKLVAREAIGRYFQFYAKDSEV